MQMLNISIKDKVVRGNGNLFMGHPICIYFNKNLYIHIKHYFPRQDSTGLKILVHAPDLEEYSMDLVRTPEAS